MFGIVKDTKHYYKVKIISRIIDWGIPISCYVGNWSVPRGATIELHKLWFFHHDQSHVGGIRIEYVIGRLVVPFIWHV